ncbi:MAG: hypothetical protein IT532_03010 [Burkholderiales bacterium]|nr:hypothetical protein [Burkholderiales bacterium]
MSVSAVALYFVASPLQYLAARRIAQGFEAGARQVLVWYKPGVAPVVRADEWDAACYMPWPRFHPLPGPFGRHRRLRQNLHMVADLAGKCERLHIHSAVFDTEAINYFLHGLPPLCGDPAMRARILPDGLISVRRYPLSLVKRALQQLRRLRGLFAPELRYWPFAGDRIGSDAPFCDRIYVLPGLPHEYDPARTVVLPPLTERAHAAGASGPLRALVIGQPLAGAGLMAAGDRDRVAERIAQWLAQQGVREIDYKAHPKDPNRELNRPAYRVVEPAEALEAYMSRHFYHFVVGVRSSALLLARQICGEETRVVAFGWDRVKFKSAQEEAAMRSTFSACRVEML